MPGRPSIDKDSELILRESAVDRQPRSMHSPEEAWADAQNWTRGEYRCAADPRLWVPKRSGGGVTLNMAHRYAQPSALLLVLALLTPTGAVILQSSRVVLV